MLLETLWQDLRYAVRILFRNAGFTAVSVFALALGIGLNTGTFTAYKAMFGRAVDARDPGTMANIALTLQSGGTAAWFSYPDYEAYRDHVHSFSGLIAWFLDERLALSDAGGVVSERRQMTGSPLQKLGLLHFASSNKEFAVAFLVSENYFRVLGVPPLRGRSFESMTRAELAASPPVLISENYWQKRFGGNPALLGKTIRLNGAAFTIIGITPHDFVGTSVVAPDFWVPLSLEPLLHPDSDWLHERENLRFRMFGRLTPGANMQQAQAEMTLLAADLRHLHDPHSELSKPATALVWPASPLPKKLSGGLQFTVVIIMIAVAMVLVIACANVASLQLARATARQNELAMRLSLGASRGRLIRQLLTESSLLGLLAGLIALPFTWALLHLAVTKIAEAFPLEFGTFIFDVNPDLEIFAYVLAISTFAGFLFGLTPALESSRSALFASIRSSSGTSAVRSRRLRDVLIAAQVAVSLVLMIAGSLLIRSAMHALGMATGYDAQHVFELSFQFPEASKYTAGRKLALVREIRTRVMALPGVAAISSARAPDDNGARQTASISVNGEKPSAQNTQATLYYTWVQADYFHTLGIPLILGRGFRAQTGQPEHSVILSESAAARLWPGRNPIGRSIRLGTDEQSRSKGELYPDGPAWQVIGVAHDTRGVALDGSDSQQVFLPLPENHLQDYPILIRTRSDPALVMRATDHLMSTIDSDLVSSTATLEEMLRQTEAFIGDSVAAAIATAVGLFGLLLASMGIYGTVSYIAVLRTREVGIRMAVGARKRDILALMMRESTRPVVAGLLAGMVLAVGASYVLRGLLYGISTVDPVSFGGMSVLFLAIALFATWPPSRRAMRVDPMAALRYE